MKITQTLDKIFLFFSKKNFIFLIFLSFFISILELISITLIFPLSKLLLSNGDKLNHYIPYLNKLDANQMITLFLISFILSSISIYIFRGFKNYFISKKLSEFEIQFFNFVSKLNLINLKNEDKSFFITKINNSIPVIFNNIINGYVTIFTNLVFLIIIVISLIIINISATVIGISILCLIFLTLSLTTKKMIFKINENNFKYTKRKHQTVLDFFNFLTLSKIFNLEKKFNINFSFFSKNLHQIRYKSQILLLSPKTLVEITLAGILIILLSFKYFKFDFELMLPLVITYFFSIYRSYPYFNEIFNSQKIIQMYDNFLKDAYNYLKSRHFSIKNDYTFKKNIYTKNIKFKKKFEIKKIYFDYKYNNNEQLLRIKEFNISKGDRILIYGRSGSGKTTLFDIILMQIDAKKIGYYVDRKKIYKKNYENFRNNFAIQTQNNIFFNSTIHENITLKNKNDLSTTEKTNFKTAIETTGLKSIFSEKEILKKNIGENANILSAGQRQRLSLARAIFPDREFLLLDEPTSNLDYKSEKEVINKICKLNKTLLVISHKKLRKNLFNKIYNLENGVLKIIK